MTANAAPSPIEVNNKRLTLDFSERDHRRKCRATQALRWSTMLRKLPNDRLDFTRAENLQAHWNSHALDQVEHETLRNAAQDHRQAHATGAP